MTPSTLERLAELAGIEAYFRDNWGKLWPAPPESRADVLRAMGLRIDTDQEAESAVHELESRRWATLPPVHVVLETEASIGVPVVVERELDTEPWDWRLIEENGTSHRGVFTRSNAEILETGSVDGRLLERRKLVLGVRLPLGYHRLELFSPGNATRPRAATALILAPARCYFPEALKNSGSSWGFAVQLYALRSRRNWGVGDFGDLRDLIIQNEPLGTGAIGLNPLHALFLDGSGRASPYAPSSRLFLNTLYLDVEAIPDFVECKAAVSQVRSPRFQEQRRALCDAPRVSYSEVAALKLSVLDLLHAAFRANHLVPRRETERGREFRRFQEEGGRPLWSHALFETLAERFPIRRGDPEPWKAWPASYRMPDSPEVTAFAEANRERLEFYQYLQWQADLQLGEAARQGRETGLSIGLFRDLAVGAAGDGSEAWAGPGMLLGEMEVGAPPDAWSVAGQTWGYPPPSPLGLRDAAYAPFCELLRANMRHAGALRIDHILGLQRLFCIPSGRAPAEGVYLRYPFDDLLSILALESQRHRCLVVGEDLGTVPDGMREKLQSAGVLSYRLLYFERDAEDRFAPPERYPRQALVAATTHDLPTMPGFWSGRDLEMKGALGLFHSSQEEQEATEARKRDKELLVDALREEGLMPRSGMPEDTTWSRVVEAVYAHLAGTRSMLLMVNLEDLVGQEDQINVPGTPDADPNWRRKLEEEIEDLFRTPLVRQVAQAIRSKRQT